MGRWQLYLGAILGIGMSGTAHAQGARAELHGGFDRVSHRSFFSPSDSTFGPVEGGVSGLGLGYDAKIQGRIFAGIEGNVDFATGSRCQVNPLVLAPGIFESCLSPGRDLSANARLGVNLGNGRTRIYGLVGYTHLELNSSFQINRGPATSLRSDNRDGVRVGAGLEHDLTDRFYGKIEYRFSDYGSDITRNQAIVGVGLRF
ncbi:outer membrane beta-barrel protein [Brevundimonas sp.]|uniref:outer membrane protein n=1 Tax=Brevundimonas sp. TaxID=1871086 RepID=UPI00261912FA|nr:outer membrane beta-barrel protein [Brevundimonas sp.]